LSVDQDIVRNARIAAHVRIAFGDRKGRKQRHHLVSVRGLRPVEEALVVNRAASVPAVLPRRRRDGAGPGPQKQRDANAMTNAAPILRQAATSPALVRSIAPVPLTSARRSMSVRRQFQKSWASVSWPPRSVAVARR